MDTDKLEEFRYYLGTIPQLRILIELRERFSLDIFIVGGIIRDFLLDRLLNKRWIEIDFAAEKDTEKLARYFCHRVRGSFVLLDGKNKSFRIVVKQRPISFQFDFSQFRAKDIKGDLYLRDFTINALAVD